MRVGDIFRFEFNRRDLTVYFIFFLVIGMMFVIFIYNRESITGYQFQTVPVSPVSSSDGSDGIDVFVQGEEDVGGPESGGGPGGGGTTGISGSSGVEVTPDDAGDDGEESEEPIFSEFVPTLPSLRIESVPLENFIELAELNPPIDGDVIDTESGFSDDSGSQDSAFCGEPVCEVVSECDTQSSTSFSIGSRGIYTGRFQKSLCSYSDNAGCTSYFSYSPCDATDRLLIVDVTGTRNLTLGISQSNLTGNETDDVIEDVQEENLEDIQQGKVTSFEILESPSSQASLAEVILDSSSRKLFIRFGEKSNIPSTCNNGVADSDEVLGIDCGFVCGPCGDDSDLRTLRNIRLSLWWTFFILAIAVVVLYSRRDEVKRSRKL